MQPPFSSIPWRKPLASVARPSARQNENGCAGEMSRPSKAGAASMTLCRFPASKTGCASASERDDRSVVIPDDARERDVPRREDARLLALVLGLDQDDGGAHAVGDLTSLVGRLDSLLPVISQQPGVGKTR